MATYIPVQNTPIQLQDTVTSVNLNSGTLEFYDAGTTDAQELFSDNSGTSIGTSITLNSGGMPESGGNVITLFRDQSKALKIVGKNSAGATIFTSDNIPAVASFDSTSSDKLDGIEAAADVTDATNVGAVVNGKQEKWIPASEFYLPTANPAGALAVTEPTAGMPSYQGHPYDGTSAEYAEAVFPFPKRFNDSTVTAQVYWTSSATDTDGVAWNVAMQALSDGDNFATAWGTAVTVVDNAQSAANELLITSETSAITIGGTHAAGDLTAIRVGRDPANASDGHAEDAVLLGVKILWTSNALNDA